MKLNKLLLSISIASIALVFLSCKKENANSNPSGINYQMRAISPTSIISRTMSGNFTWTSGYAYATEIKFEAESRNVEVEFKSQIPQRIDLFSGIVNLGNITLPAGTYDEVEFEVTLNSSASNAAFELNGQFTSGSTTTPVIFKVLGEMEVETERDNVVITDNNGYKALTTLNLSLLTTGITESMLNNATRTNGTIIISSTSNVNIYNIILNNLTDCDGVEFEDD